MEKPWLTLLCSGLPKRLLQRDSSGRKKREELTMEELQVRACVCVCVCVCSFVFFSLALSRSLSLSLT
jgi:hypothetical protein